MNVSSMQGFNDNNTASKVQILHVKTTRQVLKQNLHFKSD